MPVPHYSLFKGWVVERQLATFNNPHYQIHAIDQTGDYRIAVNVFSNFGHIDGKPLSQVEFTLADEFCHPIVPRLTQLTPGLYPLDTPKFNPLDGQALDYVRGKLFNPDTMRLAPFNLPGVENDLNECLDQYVRRAIADKESLICAFGSSWKSERWPDKVFGFKPANGLHNIHMNQGNPPGIFAGENGAGHDGGLLIYLAKEKRWVAFFIKFQPQAWDTWNDSGQPKDNLAAHYRFLQRKASPRRRPA